MVVGPRVHTVCSAQGGKAQSSYCLQCPACGTHSSHSYSVYRHQSGVQAPNGTVISTLWINRHLQKKEQRTERRILGTKFEHQCQVSGITGFHNSTLCSCVNEKLPQSGVAHSRWLTQKVQVQAVLPDRGHDKIICLVQEAFRDHLGGIPASPSLANNVTELSSDKQSSIELLASKASITHLGLCRANSY